MDQAKLQKRRRRLKWLSKKYKIIADHYFVKYSLIALMLNKPDRITSSRKIVAAFVVLLYIAVIAILLKHDQINNSIVMSAVTIALLAMLNLLLSFLILPLFFIFDYIDTYYKIYDKRLSSADRFDSKIKFAGASVVIFGMIPIVLFLPFFF